MLFATAGLALLSGCAMAFQQWDAETMKYYECSEAQLKRYEKAGEEGVTARTPLCEILSRWGPPHRTQGTGTPDMVYHSMYWSRRSVLIAWANNTPTNRSFRPQEIGKWRVVSISESD